MAWNRPKEREQGIGNREQGARKSPFRGLIAAAIIVLGAAVAAWWLWPTEKRGEDTASAKKGLIKEVAPAATNKTPAVAEEKEDRNSLDWLKKHDRRYFIPEDAVRHADGRLYTKDGLRILEDLPTQKIRMDHGRKKIFEHPAERAIARLLSIEPGQFFLGNGYYGPKFIESFKQSISEPTLITKDDDDETRALKKQVNEVKAELNARLKDGEDIVKLLKDSEQELRSLSNYRLNLQKELKAFRLDENVSEADYADYIAAANKMLKDRGMKGLSVPSLAEGQLKVIRERHKAKLAAKEKAGATTEQTQK